MTAHLALVAGGAGVIAPRSQMGFSLGWHIILACLGVGLAVLLPSLALLFSAL
jgi:cytochrome d ubiquinol oxidase subunit I